MNSRRVYLLRHFPSKTAEGVVPGRDPPIVPPAAEKLDKVLSCLPEAPECWLSPLQRCAQTLDLLERRGLEPVARQVVEELREMELGDWHSKPIAEVWQSLQDEAAHPWHFLNPQTLPPGGESFQQLIVRVRSIISTIEMSSEPLLIVGHAEWMRACLAATLNMSAEDALGTQMSPGAVLELELSLDEAQQNWRLCSLAQLDN